MQKKGILVLGNKAVFCRFSTTYFFWGCLKYAVFIFLQWHSKTSEINGEAVLERFYFCLFSIFEFFVRVEFIHPSPPLSKMFGTNKVNTQIFEWMNKYEIHKDEIKNQTRTSVNDGQRDQLVCNSVHTCLLSVSCCQQEGVNPLALPSTIYICRKIRHICFTFVFCFFFFCQLSAAWRFRLLFQKKADSPVF